VRNLNNDLLVKILHDFQHSPTIQRAYSRKRLVAGGIFYALIGIFAWANYQCYQQQGSLGLLVAAPASVISLSIFVFFAEKWTKKLNFKGRAVHLLTVRGDIPSGNLPLPLRYNISSNPSCTIIPGGDGAPVRLVRTVYYSAEEGLFVIGGLRTIWASAAKGDTPPK